MKKTIKKIAIGVLGPVTLQLIKDKTLDRKRTEVDFAARVRFFSEFFKPGDLFFDVGANLGNRIEPILKIGGKVIAVEPQTFCATYLRRKFADKIVLVQKGLAAKEGKMSIHISESHTLSTFSTDWIDKVKGDRFQGQEWNKTELVQMTTLDRLIEQYGTPDFIKIDVEGYELEVLKGLSRPIKMISLEYAVPESLGHIIACIKQAGSLSNSLYFNYSTGESMQWSLDRWLSMDDMLAYIETDEFISTGFGDIYIKKCH